MLTTKEVETIDRSHLYRDYENWPILCRNACKAKVQSPRTLGVTKIICSGMGGSGIVGDILMDWLQLRIPVPIYVVKDFHIPSFVDERTLMIAVSYSGNTDETINTVLEASRLGANIAAISSGGKLEEVSLSNGVAHTKIEALLSPRSSLPNLFYPVANILRNTGLIKDNENELENSVKAIENLRNLVSINTPTCKNLSKSLAKQIHRSLPVVYTSQLLRGAALRFKNSLNENAKMRAVVELVPELCHNEIETWVKNARNRYKPIFLRFPNEPYVIQDRFKFIRDIIEVIGFKTEQVHIQASDPLDVILCAIYLLDYTSIYVAIMRKINPLPTPNIKILKEKISDLQLNKLPSEGMTSV